MRGATTYNQLIISNLIIYIISYIYFNWISCQFTNQLTKSSIEQSLRKQWIVQWYQTITCTSVFYLTGLWTLSLCVSHQYHLVNDQMTWADAQQYCRHKFTDLATIHTLEDVETLKRVVDSQAQVNICTHLSISYICFWSMQRWNLSLIYYCSQSHFASLGPYLPYTPPVALDTSYSVYATPYGTFTCMYAGTYDDLAHCYPCLSSRFQGLNIWSP